MKVLVVLAHPNPDSFSHAIVDKASATLTECGHSVSVIDLYAIGYSPGMTRAELAAYPTSTPAIDPTVIEHTRLIQECSAIVFVHPTWWSSMPAILKGYVRAGCGIGDGAVVDRQFGTTDVFIYFPVSGLDARYKSRFGLTK